MNMKKLLILICLLPLFAQAQNTNGTLQRQIASPNALTGVFGAVRDSLYTRAQVRALIPSVPAGLQDSLNKKINTSYPVVSFNGTQYSGKDLYWLGNSLTRGTLLGADSLLRFPTRVSGYEGAVEFNRGISGSTMMYQFPYVASAMTQRLSNIPTKTDAIRALFFEFGVNDMVRSGSQANYSVANFKAAYDTVILNAKSKGWNATDIIILSPTWITDSAYAVLAAGGLTGGSDAVTQTFISASRDIAFKYGTKFINLYQIQRSNGGSGQLSDGIHPNVAGNLIIAKGIYKYLSGVFPDIYLPLSGGTMSGEIFSSKVGTFLSTTNLGTEGGNISIINNGGNLFLGRDNSTGSLFGSAYSSNLYSDGAYPVRLWQDGAVRLTLGASSVFSGTASATRLLSTAPSAGLGTDSLMVHDPTSKELKTAAASSVTVGNATKLATSRTIGTLTGDVTSAGSTFDGTTNNTNATVLATVNSNVGSFGTATQSPTITVNGKGLVTAVSNTTITPAVGSITGLGTGVATALAVNTGSAGSFVINGGALGTPSSGVATNLTGTATALNIGGSAATLTTTRTIFGQNFNGSANVSGALSGATTGNFSGLLTLGGGLNVTGFSAPASGKNIEIGHNGTTGIINSFDRTGVAFEPLSMGTSALTVSGQLGIGGVSNSVTSDTWTPTLTNGTNIASSTANVGRWQRVGKIVSGDVRISISTTSTGASVISFSLPVASAMTVADDLSATGTGSYSPVVATQVYGFADTTNDRAQIQFFSSAGSSTDLYIHFSYEVK